MRTLPRSILLGLTASLAFTANAAPTVINFDTDPDGAAVASGAPVNSVYSSLGVTFSREGATCSGAPDVYASSDQPAGFGSAPNVVTTCKPPISSDINDSGYGVIKAQFDRNATQVCINVRPDGPAHYATLKVYDLSDALITSVSSSAGVTGQICASGLGIRAARFAGGSPSAFARFDDMVITFGGGAATQTYYDGFIAFAQPMCSSAYGGSITTGTRTAIWNTPSGGATEMRVDSVSGTPMGSVYTYAAPAGSGVTNYASFLAPGLGHYPFTYIFQFTTVVGGSPVSVSTSGIHCVADGPGGTFFQVGKAPPSLENPQPSSYQSGIGLVSGWSCNREFVAVSFDGLARINVPYGSSRADTASVCGSNNTDTGFGLLTNFNILGTGSHTVQLYVNGQSFGSPVSFHVTAPAGEFLTGASKSTTVSDFPSSGRSTTLLWQQSQQNFAIQSTTP